MYHFPCSSEYLCNTFVEWAEDRYTEQEFDEIGDDIMLNCVIAYNETVLPVTFFVRMYDV